MKFDTAFESMSVRATPPCGGDNAGNAGCVSVQSMPSARARCHGAFNNRAAPSTSANERMPALVKHTPERVPTTHNQPCLVSRERSAVFIDETRTSRHARINVSIGGRWSTILINSNFEPPRSSYRPTRAIPVWQAGPASYRLCANAIPGFPVPRRAHRRR